MQKSPLYLGLGLACLLALGSGIHFISSRAPTGNNDLSAIVISAMIKTSATLKVLPVPLQASEQSLPNISPALASQSASISILNPVSKALQSITKAVTNFTLPTSLALSSVPQVETPSALPVAETVQGILQKSHWDNFADNTETPMIQVLTATGAVRLDIGDLTDESLPDSGSIVEVSGTMNDGVLAISDPSSVTEISAPTDNTEKSLTATETNAIHLKVNPAPRKVSIVMYKFADDANVAPPFTKEQVRENFFDPEPGYGITMSQFLSDSTYGKLSLTGKTSSDGSTDIYGWYTVAETKPPCSSAEGTYAYIDAGQQAIQMAMQDGLQLGPDDYVVAGTFPDNCPTGGSAGYLLTDGTEPTNYQQVGVPLVRYISMDNLLSWGNTLHEFGHLSAQAPAVLGSEGEPEQVEHSNSLPCTNSLGGPSLWGFVLPGNCSHLEYGSPFSVLGGYTSGAQKTRFLDFENKFEAGYLTASNFETADVSGVYDLVKVNYQNANILEIPFYDDGPMYVGNQAYGSPTSLDYIDLEARDFLPIEQGTDTAPNTNVITMHKGTELLANPAGANPNLVAPNETVNMAALGIQITNLGATPGNADEVRVKVTYTKPLTQRFVTPGIELEIAQSPTYITVNSAGSFPERSVSIKNTGTLPMNLHVQQVTEITRLYPSPASLSSIPMDSVLRTGWAANLPSGLPSALTAGQTYTYQPLYDLNITPANLANSPRFIYKIGTEVTSPNLNILPTYLVYGQFTVSELTNLGVLLRVTNLSGSQEDSSH